MGTLIYAVIQIAIIIYGIYIVSNAKEARRRTDEEIRLTGKVESRLQRILLVCGAPLMGFGYFIGIPLFSKQPITSYNFVLSSIISILMIGVLLYRFSRQDRILRERDSWLEMQANKTLQPTPSRDAPISHDRPDSPKDLY